jgi:integrase
VHTYILQENSSTGSLKPERWLKFFGHVALNHRNCGSFWPGLSTFNKIWRDAVLPTECRPKPRAYDFRHHFAFTNINRWVKEGINVNGMLPSLMNYMGHSSIQSTFYYIHLIPEFFGVYLEKTKALENMIPEVG